RRRHPTNAQPPWRRPPRSGNSSTEAAELRAERNTGVAAASVRVLVLPPSAGLGWLGLRRSLQQEAVVRRDERVGRHHRVRVVDGPVLARERDPTRALAQPVLELGPDLA